MAAQTTTDYDSDNDGLIAVANLAQLNAIRWDLNGDGSVDDTANQASYTAAFPDAATSMGCPSTGCIGYELTANLNFDTDGDGDVDADDAGGAYWNGDLGWAPIGYYLSATDNSPFAATFEGNNRSITNLYINRSTASGVGLFGYVGAGAEVRNVRLRGGTVTGQQQIGGLVGRNTGTVRASSASGAVSGQQWIGGLAGQNRGTISASSASGAVSGQQQTGGLVGRNHGGAISHSHASGAVSGQQWVGGLVGSNATGATISSSHATGTVTGTDPATSSSIGGLAGYNDGTIEDSYHETGTVSGSTRIGGLVGYSYQGTIRDDSYASSTR